MVASHTAKKVRMGDRYLSICTRLQNELFTIIMNIASIDVLEACALCKYCTHVSNELNKSMSARPLQQPHA